MTIIAPKLAGCCDELFTDCEEHKLTPKKKVSKPKAKPDIRIQILRNIFRNLHAFRAAYEDSGVSEIVDPEGIRWSLWDLNTLYDIAVNTTLLPLRQRQAIELFLVLNLPEDKVAEIMGIKISNPVGMYATSGLTHLLREMDAGKIINPWEDDS
jgi:DNA-directed RNA polymerase specialized sigma24 family protein